MCYFPNFLRFFIGGIPSSAIDIAHMNRHMGAKLAHAPSNTVVPPNVFFKLGRAPPPPLACKKKYIEDMPAELGSYGQCQLQRMEKNRN